MALSFTQAFKKRSSHFLCVKRDVLLHFQLDQWPRSVSAKFQYSIYPITFSVGDADEWKKLFKPCAAQRLFLPVSAAALISLHILATTNVINVINPFHFCSKLHIPYPLFYPSVRF